MRSKELEIIKMYVQNIRVGRPTYLNSYEESLLVSSADIEVAHGIPIDVNTLGSELQFFIQALNAQQLTKDITVNSSSKYTRSVIKRVNRKEYGHYM